MFLCVADPATRAALKHAAFVSQSYTLTHPSHENEVVTRPFTGVRDVHPFGFVVLFCLGTRRCFQWWETSSLAVLFSGRSCR